MSSAPRAVEANADGLVGPTHSYAGLSPGNLASEKNRGEVSNPRAAALEGPAQDAAAWPTWACRSSFCRRTSGRTWPFCAGRASPAKMARCWRGPGARRRRRRGGLFRLAHVGGERGDGDAFGRLPATGGCTSLPPTC
jgi:hypothetical protein